MTDSNHAEPSPPKSGPDLPKLYSLNGIGFATFFGSMLAGFFLLAANYHALGMRRPALAVIGAGLVAFCLYFVVVMNLIGPASMGPGMTQEGAIGIDMTTAIFSNVGQVLFLLLVTHLLQGNMLTTFRDELSGQFHSVTRSIFLGFVAYLGLASVCLIILSVLGLMPLSTDRSLAA